MALDARLLEILACPDEKGPLYYFEPDVSGTDGAFLLCPACRRRYDVRDDIPVMLLDEAVVLTAEESDGLVARAKKHGLAPTFTR